MGSIEKGQDSPSPLNPKVIAKLTEPEILARPPQGFGSAVNQLAIQAGLLRRGELAEAAMTAMSPRTWTESLSKSREFPDGELFTRVHGQGPDRTRIVFLGVTFTDGPRRITDSTDVYAVLGNGLIQGLSRTGKRIASGQPETIDGVPIWTRIKALIREAHDPETNTITYTIYQYEDRPGHPDHRIKQIWRPKPVELNQDMEPWSELEVSEGQPLALTVRVPSRDGSLQATYEIQGDYGRLDQYHEEACLYRRSDGKSPTSDLSSQGSPIRESFKSLPEKIDLKRVYDNLASGRPGLEGIWQLQI